MLEVTLRSCLCHDSASELTYETVTAEPSLPGWAVSWDMGFCLWPSQGVMVTSSSYSVLFMWWNDWRPPNNSQVSCVSCSVDSERSPDLPYVYVNSSGTIKNSKPIQVVSACSLETYTFPFDIQNCSLTFRSILHTGKPWEVQLAHGKMCLSWVWHTGEVTFCCPPCLLYSCTGLTFLLLLLVWEYSTRPPHHWECHQSQGQPHPPTDSGMQTLNSELISFTARKILFHSPAPGSRWSYRTPCQ